MRSNHPPVSPGPGLLSAGRNRDLASDHSVDAPLVANIEAHISTQPHPEEKLEPEKKRPTDRSSGEKSSLGVRPEPLLMRSRLRLGLVRHELSRWRNRPP